MRALFLTLAWLLAAFTPANFAAEPLFADPVRVKGKGIEIRQSDIEEGYVAYKAARAALGQRLPNALEDQVKEQVLEKLIATKLLLDRATPSDREEGKKIADRLIDEGKQKLSSEASYRRQMHAVGTTPEKYEADILEQAIVKAVIDRELKSRQVIGDEEVRTYYEEHPSLFTEPEKVRVQHLLVAIRKYPSGELLPLKEQAAQSERADQALACARAGEDFTKLIKEYSEDPDLARTKGELTFGPRGPVPPEFEAAAFSLEPGQVSGIVRSLIGFHIIKLMEKVPARQAPLENVTETIRNMLKERNVQQQLAGYIEQLKKEAGVEILPE